jgi:hypothetical protein
MSEDDVEFDSSTGTWCFTMSACQGLCHIFRPKPFGLMMCCNKIGHSESNHFSISMPPKKKAKVVLLHCSDKSDKRYPRIQYQMSSPFCA